LLAGERLRHAEHGRVEVVEDAAHDRAGGLGELHLVFERGIAPLLQRLLVGPSGEEGERQDQGRERQQQARLHAQSESVEHRRLVERTACVTRAWFRPP
jgi:hypothetical protein